MKRITLISIAIVCFTSAFTQNTVTFTDLPQDRIEIIFNKAKIFPDNTQMAFAFIENGQTQYYGIIKEKETIKYIDNSNKVFEIGSISKVFTATLLADAVINGKIALGDHINSFYDFTFHDSIFIDFLSLANHTSGLDRLPSNLDLSEFMESETSAIYKNPYKKYDEAKLKTYLKNQLELGQVREKVYNYSNLGVGLLGYTLGVLHGYSYGEILYDKIFQKYGMTNSYSNINQVKGEVIRGLDNDGIFVGNWEWDSDVLLGAGSILSTATDLAKFANAQFNLHNKELALTRIPTFTVNENVKVGMGWHIINNGTQELHWHNGGTGGYTSSMAIDVNARKGVIILSNVSGFNPNMEYIDALCFELMKIME